MKYTRLIRKEPQLWAPVIELLKNKQPNTYRDLKSRYPGITRIVSDEREYRRTKRLIEEKRGVEI